MNFTPRNQQKKPKLKPMSDTSKAIAANTKFTAENIPELTDLICELIAVGWGLQQVLDSSPDFPKAATFYKWLDSYPDVVEKYARARDRQQDYEADNMIAIADGATDPNKARIQIDARKWRASKLAPKKYGDKLDLNHSGNVSLTEAEIDAKLAVLLGKAGMGSLT